MSDDDIRAGVREAIQHVAPEADLEHLASGRPMRDQLDLDSFDFLQILVGIEARLGVTVPERDYPHIVSLDDLVRYVHDHR